MVGTLVSKQEIAINILEIRFAVPDEFGFQAGQYIQLVLWDQLKHYFSIVNSPNEKNTVVICTRLSGSDFKKQLQALEQGTEVRINGPWGDFLLPASRQGGPEPSTSKVRSHFFVAGGIGITPFVSMLRYITEENLPYKIELFWVSEDTDLPYLQEFKTYEKNNPDIKIHNSPEPPLKLRGGEGELYYLAGPPGFVNQTDNALRLQSVDPRNIITDSFTGY